MISRIIVSPHTHSGSASMRWASLNEIWTNFWISYKTCAFQSEHPNFLFVDTFHFWFSDFLHACHADDLNEWIVRILSNDLTHRCVTTYAFRKRIDALSKSEWKNEKQAHKTSASESEYPNFLFSNNYFLNVSIFIFFIRLSYTWFEWMNCVPCVQWFHASPYHHIRIPEAHRCVEQVWMKNE